MWIIIWLIVPVLLISINVVSCLSCCSGSAKSKSQVDDGEHGTSWKQQHCVIVFSFGLIIDFKGKIWILTLRIVFTNWYKIFKIIFKRGLWSSKLWFLSFIKLSIQRSKSFRWKFLHRTKVHFVWQTMSGHPLGPMSNTFMRCLGCAQCVS